MGGLRKSTMNKIGIGVFVALVLFLCKPQRTEPRPRTEDCSCSGLIDLVPCLAPSASSWISLPACLSPRSESNLHPPVSTRTPSVLTMPPPGKAGIALCDM